MARAEVEGRLLQRTEDIISREEVEGVIDSFGDRYDEETKYILRKLELQQEVSRLDYQVQKKQWETVQAAYNVAKTEKASNLLKRERIELSTEIASKVSTFRQALNQMVINSMTEDARVDSCKSEMRQLPNIVSTFCKEHKAMAIYAEFKECVEKIGKEIEFQTLVKQKMLAECEKERLLAVASKYASKIREELLDKIGGTSQAYSWANDCEKALADFTEARLSMTQKWLNNATAVLEVNSQIYLSGGADELFDADSPNKLLDLSSVPAEVMKLLKKEMLFGVEYDPLLVEMTRILKDYQQISKNCDNLVNDKTEQFFLGKFDLCSLEIKQRYLELAALVSAKGAEAMREELIEKKKESEAIIIDHQAEIASLDYKLNKRMQMGKDSQKFGFFWQALEESYRLGERIKQNEARVNLALLPQSTAIISRLESIKSDLQKVSLKKSEQSAMEEVLASEVEQVHEKRQQLVHDILKPTQLEAYNKLLAVLTRDDLEDYLTDDDRSLEVLKSTTESKCKSVELFIQRVNTG